MRHTTRCLLVLFLALGCWAMLNAPSRRAAPVPRGSDPGVDDFLASAAGEEDPGAAVDSPAPPRPVGGG